MWILVQYLSSCELLKSGIPVSFFPVYPALSYSLDGAAFSQHLLMVRELIFVILGSEKGLAKQCLAGILEMDLSLTFVVHAGPTLA